MSRAELYESLMAEICGLDRAAIEKRLANFPGDMPLDFTAEYLAACDTDRLRHLLLAAEWRLRSKILPAQ